MSNFCVRFRPDLLADVTIAPPKVGESNALQGAASVVHLLTKTGRKAKFLLATATLDVIYFSLLDGFSGRASEGTNALSSAKLERLADSILSNTGTPTNLLKKVRAKTVAIAARSKQQLFEVLWQRHQNGFEFKHDVVRVVLNPIDGELLAYRKNWGRTPDSFTVKVSKDAAHQKACSLVVDHFKAEQPLRPIVSGPLVVCPNRAFGATATDAETRRLAWAVEIPKQKATTNALEVWIDAVNGQPLGGEVLW